MTHRFHLPVHIQLLLFLVVLVSPLTTAGAPQPPVAYEQTFILTAYYSPEPGQCCYVKGGLAADRILNGQGTHGADGTAVYPGMLAAPPTYAFGTVIDLPGLGIMTVHDRGGAIQELDNGYHRLDVWAGYGEEGLARALAFGVQTITATVYPLGTDQPAESIDLANLPAPAERLRQYLVHGDNLMAMSPSAQTSGLSTLLLQEQLHLLGYLKDVPTGFFGEQTQAALAHFNTDHSLSQPSDRLTETTAAYILAAVRRKAARAPIQAPVNEQASAQSIMDAQRTLRFLGYYRGRTDGQYSETLSAAILRFQQDHGLVGTAADPGAGQIGPITTRTLVAQWNKELVARRAARYLDTQQVSTTLDDKGLLVDRFLEEGYTGDAVRSLQQSLSDLGYFAAEEINGNFGPMTKDAVVKYQLANGIIGSSSDDSAGRVGPATLSKLRSDQLKKYYNLVRSQGWSVL